ncbi:MAG TPA: hypothetical protein VFQ61_33955 [Polyangiaceae bacterium]|nr:hypothetical protein [Polyangiaceae bacterium]
MEDARVPFGRDVYLALASVGWERGMLQPHHADAIVRLALDECLDFEEVLEIEEAIRHPVALAMLEAARLSKSDRLFLYAVGVWIAGMGDHRGAFEERAALGEGALARLGTALRVDSRAQRIVEGIVAKFTESCEQRSGGRSSRLDTKLLRRTILERVSAAEQRRASGIQPRQSAAVALEAESRHGLASEYRR